MGVSDSGTILGDEYCHLKPRMDESYFPLFLDELQYVLDRIALLTETTDF